MSKRQSGRHYHETAISDGPLVLSHAMPQAQSVALGIFIDVGSRDEAPEQAGITHALEHMLFKGTRTLDVDRLAEALDDLGGTANAFTSRERTCFHIHVLHEQWREALEILLEMVREPAIPAEEWQREREVIYAEMGMVEDSPEEWVTDQHIEALFSNHAIGRPVLGNHDTLAAFSAGDLRQYLQRWYRPPHLLVAAAGRIEHDEFVEAVAAHSWQQSGAPHSRSNDFSINQGIQQLAKDYEQAQMIISYPGIASTSVERPQAWLTNLVLGGGMSSRLFREVREKRGLVYGIGSHLNTLSDGGCWTISCGTDPERAPECAALIAELLAKFADSITDDEVERAKRQLEVQFRMGMDSVEGQMLYLGARLDEPHLNSPTEWLQLIRDVDPATIRDWAAARLAGTPLWSIAAPQRALDKICDSIRTC